jgi:hypothetical protein
MLQILPAHKGGLSRNYVPQNANPQICGLKFLYHLQFADFFDLRTQLFFAVLKLPQILST